MLGHGTGLDRVAETGVKGSKPYMVSKGLQYNWLRPTCWSCTRILLGLRVRPNCCLLFWQRHEGTVQESGLFFRLVHLFASDGPWTCQGRYRVWKITGSRTESWNKRCSWRWSIQAHHAGGWCSWKRGQRDLGWNMRCDKWQSEWLWRSNRQRQQWHHSVAWSWVNGQPDPWQCVTMVTQGQGVIAEDHLTWLFGSLIHGRCDRTWHISWHLGAY